VSGSRLAESDAEPTSSGSYGSRWRPSLAWGNSSSRHGFDAQRVVSVTLCPRLAGSLARDRRARLGLRRAQTTVDVRQLSLYGGGGQPRDETRRSAEVRLPPEWNTP